MTISITRLRANLYQIIDQVINTRKPIEIERKGQKLKIALVKKHNKLAQLKPHPGTIIGDPDDLVHMDWSKNWKEGKDL